jgi:hypothetical protein
MIEPPLPQDQITHRPLPESDASIDGLTHEERAIAGERWIGRSHNELETGRAFDYIARSLSRQGAEPELVALAVRSADDEVRHSEICRRVASAYLGHDVEPAALARVEGVPPAGGEPLPAWLSLTMYIIEMSCLSEGIGTAVLEANLAYTKTPLAHAALRELLTDEVNHARLGWAHLARLDDARRDEVGTHLLASVKRVFNVWDYRNQYPTSPALTDHGCPPIEIVRAAILSGVRDLALPGFAHVGVPVQAAADWFGTATARE